MILKAEGLEKAFGNVNILQNVSLELEPGSSVAIIGKSGSGKSTLLHILGTLENPDSGHIKIDNESVHSKNCEEIRRKKIGFIFQNFNVLDDFTVLDNLKIACQVRKTVFDQFLCMEMLEKVELKDKATAMTKVLSGGEKQRLAIARALIHNPQIILADEPTGSLDHLQGEIIEKLLFDGVKAHRVSLVIVTHDLDLAKKCDRILQLKDGILIEYL